MADRATLERECAAFARYLGAGAGDAYVTEQYVAAHEAGVVELPGTTGFERSVVALARALPWSLRALDAHARVFGNGSLLRRKLVLLLAILETRAPHDEALDTPTAGSNLGMFVRMAWLGAVFATLVVVTALLLLPVRVVSLAGGAR
ncbi:MAG: hypothetical protein NTV21_19145 [Planctomycetota bacterium]|nr:hypothetical protein [Planctomycetota bacterium]